MHANVNHTVGGMENQDGKQGEAVTEHRMLQAKSIK